jgi:hypothetical protein
MGLLLAGVAPAAALIEDNVSIGASDDVLDRFFLVGFATCLALGLIVISSMIGISSSKSAKTRRRELIR